MSVPRGKRIRHRLMEDSEPSSPLTGRSIEDQHELSFDRDIADKLNALNELNTMSEDTSDNNNYLYSNTKKNQLNFPKNVRIQTESDQDISDKKFLHNYTEKKKMLDEYEINDQRRSSLTSLQPLILRRLEGGEG
jgi:hypothetical protein